MPCVARKHRRRVSRLRQIATFGGGLNFNCLRVASGYPSASTSSARRAGCAVRDLASSAMAFLLSHLFRQTHPCGYGVLPCENLAERSQNRPASMALPCQRQNSATLKGSVGG